LDMASYTKKGAGGAVGGNRAALRPRRLS
jgi:hypothetical protein